MAETDDDPPQLSVPVTADAHQRLRWRQADAAGSANGACAVGILAMQAGDLPTAESALRRAETRGSAAAGFPLGLVLANTGRLAEAEETWRLADVRGSAPAAYMVAQFDELHDDAAGAAEARTRALGRAEEADREGSADAACLLAEMYAEQGNADDRDAALRRADERGSAGAAYAVADLAFDSGDAPGGEAALERASEGGVASAAYSLGLVKVQQGDRAAARRAWRRARTIAITQGDLETYRAVRAELRPSGPGWFRAYPGLAVALVATVLVTWLVTDWRGALASVAAIAAAFAWRRPLLLGAPIYGAPEAPERGTAEFTIGGLTLTAGAGELKRPGIDDEVPVRYATRRDQWLYLSWPAVLTALAGVLAAWAAGWISTDTTLRCIFGVLTVVLLWPLINAAPSLLRPPSPSPSSRRAKYASMFFVAKFEVLPFVKWVVRVSVRNPALEPLVDRLEATHSQSDSGLRIAAGVASLLPVVAAAAFLAAFAVTPAREDGVKVAWDIASAVIEMTTSAMIIVVCVVRTARAARRRDAAGLLAVVGWLAAGAGAIAIASALGLLEKWITVWDWITDAM